MTEQVNKTSAVVELDDPIMRGETEITRVTVRKPKSGALRGVRLVALMDMDVTAMTEVLPRITDPALTKPEIMAMPPGDLLNMSIEVVNFLLPKSMQADYRND
ncbi:phage tail assembly protein [Morganella morganii subsp. sibonii]|uniref:phage tail assembly protein n=1 Tax=Morganella morganii TaxID=582 RepID=UPI001BD1E13C|nr:phage tail assembly protein [Morganella morganii]MBS9544172.1 phage tail assembly protein [Morganella morganii subsp. morganii]